MKLIQTYIDYIKEDNEYPYSEYDDTLFKFLQNKCIDNRYIITKYMEHYIKIIDKKIYKDDNCLFLFHDNDFNIKYILKTIEGNINDKNYEDNLKYNIKFLKFVKPLLKEYKKEYIHLLNANKFDLL